MVKFQLILSAFLAIAFAILLCDIIKDAVTVPPSTENIAYAPLQYEPVEPTVTEEQVSEKIEPAWTTYPVVRQVTNLGKVLSDIDSHMPAGHIYRDAAKVTWGHETTHGINSQARIKFANGQKINAFYCLEDKVAVIQEPRCLISHVAPTVPASLRDQLTYNLYLIRQQSGWNDCPLYLCDELSAYANGAAVRKDLQLQERADTVRSMFAFIGYSIAMAKVAKEKDPNYDHTQLRAFLMWQTERAMSELYNNEQGATEYLQKLRTAPDAESLRQFSREYFGAEWCKRVLEF